MDRNQTRRERLARLSLDAIPTRQGRGWRAGLSRAVDLSERFLAFSGWEKAFFLGGCLLAIVLAIGAVVALTKNATGGDDRPAVVGLPRPRATATALPPTPVPTATATALFVAAPTQTPKPPNREDCDAIRGTAYQSPEEREWFLENCQEPVTVAGRSPTPSQPSPTSPSAPPAPSATPPPGSGAMSSGEAIWLAVAWMTSEAPEAYTVDAGSCTAVWFGGHWVVTCSATLAGCQGAGCQRTLSACVYDDPRRVVPSAQC